MSEQTEYLELILKALQELTQEVRALRLDLSPKPEPKNWSAFSKSPWNGATPPGTYICWGCHFLVPIGTIHSCPKNLGQHYTI